MSVRRLLALGSCLPLALSGIAQASQSFPDTVKDEWRLPEVPACTLCHQTLLGGFGTASKPFGRVLLEYGATAADTRALRDALRAMHADNSDVDHDGVSDLDELQTGSDPDLADATDSDRGLLSATFDDTPIPRTGCSVVAVGQRVRLTAPQPSPTVGPISGADAPSRRISGDALLVCGLILGAITGRLRARRKRVAGPAR